MDVDNSELIAGIAKKFGLDRSELVPKSAWFSYGSSMNVNDLKSRVDGLKLGNVRVAKLTGYERRLGNNSKKHGLAYTIRCRPYSAVYGIVHDIPVDKLWAYLRKEGVANQKGI